MRPKTKSVSSHGSFMPKDKADGGRVVPTSSHPIIGESAAMFTDMTDTMLKVLDRRMAATAQARELENTLAENAYAIGQNRQSITGYLPDPVTCHSLSFPTFLYEYSASNNYCGCTYSRVYPCSSNRPNTS